MNDLGYVEWMVIFGLVLAVLLGIPMVILFAMLLRDKGRKKCPHCAEAIQAEAKICRFCNRPVE